MTASGGRCGVSEYDPAGTASAALLFLLLASFVALFIVAWCCLLESARALIRRHHRDR